MPFKQIVTKDQNLQLIQSAVAGSLNSLENEVMVKGSLLSTALNPNANPGTPETSLTLVAGQDNLVAHGLNGPLTLWIITRLNKNAVIWEVATPKLAGSDGVPQSSNSNYINLWTSANCTISLFVS